MECHIVRDLLPSYQDGLLSEESKAFVSEHLKSCNACREELRIYSMDLPEEIFHPENKIKDVSEESFRGFVGSVRRRKIIYSVTVALIACLVMTAAYFLIANSAVIGREKLSADGSFKYSVDSNNAAVIISYLRYDSTGLIIPDEIDGHKTDIIESGAFEGHPELEELTIPKTVRQINPSAFSRCPDLHIKTDPENPAYEIIDEVLFRKDQSELIWYPESKTDEFYEVPEGTVSIYPYAFAGNQYIKEIRLPDGIRCISEYTFTQCTNLETVDIPSGVEFISADAFAGCDNLARINLSEGLKFIGDRAFFNCRKLTELVIPDGVTEIGTSAFGMCRTLETVTIPDSVTDIGTGAFLQCHRNLTIICGEESYAMKFAKANLIEYKIR
ncbi:MAG: leucine-rich repeat protein [Parasporobacterium sp.]|nr:leucine-rich repeat protein [Parasporobacterium sp.]